MKTLAFFILLFTTYIVNAGIIAPQVLMRNCAFRNADGSNYIETQFSILHSSIHFIKNKNNTYQASYSVHITYNDVQNVMLKELSYNLSSSEVADTSNDVLDMIDLKRTSVPDGTIKVVMNVRDNNDDKESSVTETVKIYFPSVALAFSSPIFVESYSPTTKENLYSRNGYDIIPKPINLYTESDTRLTFYQEIYNASEANSEDIVIYYSICNMKEDDLDDYTYMVHQKSAKGNALFSSIDISKLPAGSYYLKVSVLNSKAEVIGSHTQYFLRTRKFDYTYAKMEQADVSNTFASRLNKDSLFYWLGSLEPPARNYEVYMIDTIVRTKDTLRAEKFFFIYWTLRYPGNEEVAWKAYKAVVDKVEYNFCTRIKHGYETDRGRVYLQYGAPNQRDLEPTEPGAFPYEIWQYNSIDNRQSNVHFIFYDPDFVSNNYKLINSDAVGELHDARWRYRIYDAFKGENGYTNIDNTDFPNSYGKRVDDILQQQ